MKNKPKHFNFAATVSNSGVLIVDADPADIDYAKGGALLSRIPSLPALETWCDHLQGKDVSTRRTSNPLASSEVEKWLNDRQISNVILMGDDSHGGIFTAAFSALELGYDVYVIDDATMFPSARAGKLFRRRLWQSGGILIAARHLALELEQPSDGGSPSTLE